MKETEAKRKEAVKEAEDLHARIAKFNSEVARISQELVEAYESKLDLEAQVRKSVDLVRKI